MDCSSSQDETPKEGAAHANGGRAGNAQAGDVDAGVATGANDIDAVRKAVEDAATVSTGLWISYVFMLFYIAIAAGAVTHVDLLLENPVKLPFLGIELPLLAFFFVAPPLFLIVHAYTLVHFVMLGRKSVHFNETLYAHFPSARTTALSEAEDQRNQQIRDGIRRQLPSNIFVQFLAGPREVRDTVFGRLLRFIAWMTLIFAPIVLLLELQIQFLPYHHFLLTWEHRLTIFVDIILISWLWRKIIDGGRNLDHWIIIFGIVAIWFSWRLAIIPGEWQEFIGYGPLYHDFFNGDIDPNSHRRTSVFSNTLVLPRFNVYDILKVDDPQKVAWRQYLLSVRGRDLRGAIFDEAFIQRTDARSAQLQGASFSFASLQGSSLDNASLQGAIFSNASLQGASLVRADLEGTDLNGAGLQGAKLESAHLAGAQLISAQLEGTNFHGADLRGADLTQASLRGTSFAGVNREAAQLQGAKFDQADLDVVSLDRAFVWRAVFSVKRFSNIFGSPVWSPLAQWGPKSYKELQYSFDAIPGPPRDEALTRIRNLDCAAASSTIASCVLPSTPPPNVSQWQSDVRNATIDQKTYERALAGVFLEIICSGDGNSLAVLRSLAKMGMPQVAGGVPKPMGLLETGSEAKGLVEYVMTAKCRISEQLTDADKAILLAVEQFSVRAADSNTGALQNNTRH
jgi:uncharacterized protein YjbI with pentapeptide repeats